MPESPDKTTLHFQQIVDRFNATGLPEVDAVVGIQTGGRIPAVLCAYRLGLPLYMLPIHFRDIHNQPERPEPFLVDSDYSLPPSGKRVLLVDDVSVTGKTFETARQLLGDSYPSITTFVLKGKGDISLFPEIRGCVNWPWQ